MAERQLPNFEKLNILIAAPYSMEPTGGVQKHIEGFGRFAKRNGHIPTLVSPVHRKHPESKKVDYADKRYFISEVKEHEHNGTIANIPSRTPVNPVEIYRTLQDAKPDIVHGHDSYASVPALQLILQSRLPIFNPKPAYTFTTFHASHQPEKIQEGKFERRQREMERKQYYQRISRLKYIFDPILDGTIVVSEATKKFAQDLYPRDHRLITNGVETGRFTNEDEKIEKYLDGKFNFLFIGRLEERKGVKHLIQSYATVKKTHEDSRLIIGGSGSQEQELKDLVERDSIQDVEFYGQVPEDDLPKLYKTADACVFPATHGEAQGLVLVEAMAAGAPVIAGNNSGYRTVIKQGENGLLINPRKISETAETMKMLMENSGYRDKIAVAGQESAKAFDWENVGPQILDYYKERIIEQYQLAS